MNYLKYYQRINRPDLQALVERLTSAPIYTETDLTGEKNEIVRLAIRTLDDIMQCYALRLFGIESRSTPLYRKVRLFLKVDDPQGFIQLLYQRIAYLYERLIDLEMFEVVEAMAELNDKLAKVIHKENKSINVRALCSLSCLAHFKEQWEKRITENRIINH